MTTTMSNELISAWVAWLKDHYQAAREGVTTSLAEAITEGWKWPGNPSTEDHEEAHAAAMLKVAAEVGDQEIVSRAAVLEAIRAAGVRSPDDALARNYEGMISNPPLVYTQHSYAWREVEQAVIREFFETAAEPGPDWLETDLPDTQAATLSAQLERARDRLSVPDPQTWNPSTVPEADLRADDRETLEHFAQQLPAPLRWAVRRSAAWERWMSSPTETPRTVSI